MAELTTKRLDSVPDIFGIETLQVILARPYRTCANLCRTPGFPARKIGREWRISRIGLERWIDREFIKCE